VATRPVVCVRDSALGAFLNPFVAPSLGTAQRQFGDEVGKADSPIHAHPEDYELWHVADFDEVTAEFSAVDRRAIARGKDFKEG
jgi:hypothetical protein